MKHSHYNIIIVGGGAAGTSVANDLKKKNRELTIAVIEPSATHYYQPAFTLVGGGVFSFKNTQKKQSDLLPAGVTWFRNKATEFAPDINSIYIDTGCELKYDYLVVCPGLQLDFDKIKGLKETLGQNNVCCNYSPAHVEYTWQTIQKINSGTALFTQPPMPIKCAGAPQKAMYLAADYFKSKGLEDKIKVKFFNAGPGIFGVPFFAQALEKVISGYDIETNYNTNLVEIDGPAKKATFQVKDSDGNTSVITREFDMIHVTPPQSAPDFIKASVLSDEAGWLDVNPETLQHKTYSNVFGLGDVTNTPNAKTAAAVRKQVPVVVDNILSIVSNTAVSNSYNGYGSCPLTTSRSTAILAEFSYGGEVTPSFPLLNPRKNRYVWWLVKRYGLPWLYWKIMLKGRRIDLPSKSSYARKYVESK